MEETNPGMGGDDTAATPADGGTSCTGGEEKKEEGASCTGGTETPQQ